ncbi:hypothetical protein BWS39_gp2 [Chicken stool-associated circular virus]|uniref:hypothetical protein n=1 Tax=Chicken stool-associated circular virus TaxID=1930302 RepID=UPI00094DF009|nr:hypothetical protein BWS39_gp2 [Chicken stool-associated circular virus]APR73485.1 hypothetical protein [Chicken stool-associated circular virus]
MSWNKYTKPLFLTCEDITSGPRVWIPPRGMAYSRVILMSNGTDRPYPWYDNKLYEIKDEGEHVLLERVDEGRPIMLYRPRVIIDTSKHYQTMEKTNKTVYPLVEEYNLLGTVPKTNVTITNDIKDEKWPDEDPDNPDEINRDFPPYGYSKVTTEIKWNGEDFPIHWLEQKEYNLEKETDENGITIDEWWRETAIEGADNIYYCGLKMNVVIRISVSAINRESLDTFKFSLAGGEILQPGESGIFIQRTLDVDSSPVEYQITLVYNNTNEIKTVFKPVSQTRHALLDFSDGYKIKIKAGHDKDMIEIQGDVTTLNIGSGLPEITCSLSAKMFSMIFGNNWKPDDE